MAGVLASNAHLMRVGPSVGERAIDDCIARAEAASSEGARLLERTWSPGRRVVALSAPLQVVPEVQWPATPLETPQPAQWAGAVTSLSSALLLALFTSKAPAPSYPQFVDRCLREKGYEPARWK